MKVIRKTLIIKIGAIGDVVLALSMTSFFKDMHLTWVVGQESQELLRAIHGVQRIITIDDKKLLERNFFIKLLEVFKIWKILFFQKFDLVITAHPDPRYRVLSWSCFKKAHRCFIKQKNSFPISGEFHGLHYMQLASGKICTKEQVVWPEISLPLITHLLDGLNSAPIVVLSPGGSKAHEGKRLRMWPVDYYLLLTQYLQKYDCRVVLVGMEQDEWISAYFIDMNVVNLIGRTTLLELIAVFKRALGVVTHDGGSLHMARLVGCKLCGIFGPTSPKDFALQGANEVVLWGGDGLSCRPCYNGKSFNKCDHQSCMKQIVPKQVLETIVREWGLKLK